MNKQTKVMKDAQNNKIFIMRGCCRYNLLGASQKYSEWKSMENKYCESKIRSRTIDSDYKKGLTG